QYEVVIDPTLEDAVVQLLQRTYPGVKPDACRKLLAELRKTGAGKLVRPYLIKDRPCVVALAPNEEIFLPSEATDIQSARMVFRVELLTETLLMEPRISNQWGEKWIELML